MDGDWGYRYGGIEDNASFPDSQLRKPVSNPKKNWRKTHTLCQLCQLFTHIPLPQTKLLKAFQKLPVVDGHLEVTDRGEDTLEEYHSSCMPRL